ncbi:MAG: cyclic nucleotide-binding domain-containing protein [Polyangiaceae bacterium]
MPTERGVHSAVERELFLRSMLFGRALGSGAKQLARGMRERSFEAGSLLFEAGAPSDDMYFIVSGSVRLSAPGVPDWEFGPSSVVGAVDADLDRPHARTARALTDVEALVLNNDDRLEVLEDNFDQTRSMILFGAERLYHLTRQLPGTDSVREIDYASCPAQDPLPLVERVLTLREAPIFSRSGIQALVSLSPYIEELRLAPGQALFERSTTRGSFCVVACGTIELERAEPHGVAHFGPGSLVGGATALADIERDEQARALSDSVVLRVRLEEFFDVMEDHFDLARSVFAYLAEERERVMNLIELGKTAVLDGRKLFGMKG